MPRAMANKRSVGFLSTRPMATTARSLSTTIFIGRSPLGKKRTALTPDFPRRVYCKVGLQVFSVYSGIPFIPSIVPSLRLIERLQRGSYLVLPSPFRTPAARLTLLMPQLTDKSHTASDSTVWPAVQWLLAGERFGRRKVMESDSA